MDRNLSAALNLADDAVVAMTGTLNRLRELADVLRSDIEEDPKDVLIEAILKLAESSIEAMKAALMATHVAAVGISNQSHRSES